jgi:hypothetical protein
MFRTIQVEEAFLEADLRVRRTGAFVCACQSCGGDRALTHTSTSIFVEAYNCLLDVRVRGRWGCIHPVNLAAEGPETVQSVAASRKCDRSRSAVSLWGGRRRAKEK